MFLAYEMVPVSDSALWAGKLFTRVEYDGWLRSEFVPYNPGASMLRKQLKSQIRPNFFRHKDCPANQESIVSKQMTFGAGSRT